MKKLSYYGYMFQLNHVSMHHILGLAIGSVTT